MQENIPCLVDARQGKTVSFQGKLLYSSYNPSASILRDVANRNFLPGTVVLCISPCLCYGIKELLEKLPENCIALGIEADEALHEFSLPYATECTHGAVPFTHDAPLTHDTPHDAADSSAHFVFVPRADLMRLPEILCARTPVLSDGTMLLPKGAVRRTVAINFSAGAAFHADFYNALTNACALCVSQFWKNRITLTKFGRLFFRNMMRNVQRVQVLDAKEFFGTVKKQIVVCGAGESLEQTVRDIFALRDLFYVIAVDAAFSALRAHGIVADAVVCEESQIAIAEAFVGFANVVNATKKCACEKSEKHHITIFAGLSSWTGLRTFTEGTLHTNEVGTNEQTTYLTLAYFATKYDDTNFFARLEDAGILPTVLPPLGSVGLTATEIALKVRASSDVPVYVTGLDFSYSVGATHTKGTFQQILNVANNYRLKPVGNYAAAFAIGAEWEKVPVYGEATFVNANMPVTEKCVVTTKSLAGYAEKFSATFSGCKNLFDARVTGLRLNIAVKQICKSVSQGDICNEEKNCTNNQNEAAAANDNAQNGAPTFCSEKKEKKLLDFFVKERNALLELRSLLAGEKNISDAERANKIHEILAQREYLYLHFPDGYALSMDTSFLKRVRSEIDFFLKDLRSY